MVVDDRLVAGVDCSTTSVKAVAFDESGRQVACTREEIALAMPAPGWHEQDAAEWERATVAALAALAAKCGAASFDAVGITHQRESFVCLDRSGMPIRPAILWLDGRAGTEIDEYGSDEVHARSGKPPDVTPALYKLAWLRRHEPRTLEQASTVCDTGGYLVRRLTGAAVTSWASADPLGILNMTTRTWDPELLEIAGLTEAVLPTLVPPGTVVGGLRGAAAQAWGANTPVVIAGGDGQCAGVGAGVVESGPAYLNLGTAMVTGVHLESYRHDRAFRTLCSVVDTAFVAEALLSSGTYLIRWFSEMFDGGAPMPSAELQAQAEAVSPGADGLFVLPYWNAAQTPYWDPDARGAIVGLCGSHGRAHLLRALMEGVAMELRCHVDALESELDNPISEFRATGGGVRNNLWAQIVADVTGRPIRICAQEEVTALGAAAVARAAVSERPLPEVAAEFYASSRTVEPDPATTEIYAAKLDRYRSLYPRLKEHFGSSTDDGGAVPAAVGTLR